MQRPKFTAEQMTAIIAESSAYKGAINDIARKYGISTKTIGNWKTKFGNMRSDDVRKLKQLEDENTK